MPKLNIVGKKVAQAAKGAGIGAVKGTAFVAKGVAKGTILAAKGVGAVVSLGLEVAPDVIEALGRESVDQLMKSSKTLSDEQLLQLYDQKYITEQQRNKIERELYRRNLMPPLRK